MDISTVLSLLQYYLTLYWPQQLDPSLRPKDSANRTEYRNVIYDFVVIGAGSAGCVMANRLSANPNWKVLLIEAGGDEDYVTDTPTLAEALLLHTKYVWNFTTTQQSAVCANEQGYCHFIQGHVMGGTSTINGMVWARGNRALYDAWAYYGDNGWTYKSVLHYFKKAENMLIQQFSTDRLYHSTSGPLPVAYGLFTNNILQNEYIVGEQEGLTVVDYNGAQQIGIDYAQLNLLGPIRCSASKAYLEPIRNRPNLVIFKNTFAIRILYQDGTKKAIGVRCVNNGEEFDVFSSKEVIISAGVIGSPKLLMLSGIGPREHLQELGIPVILDLPVGENLADLPALRMTYQVNNKELNYDDNRLTNAIIEYAKDKQGLLTTPRGQVVGIFNTNDLTATNTIPDVLYLYEYLLPPFSTITNTSGLSVLINCLTPKSRGTVRLRSTNYADSPLINPNYYSNPEDLQLVIREMQIIDTFFKNTSLANYNPIFNVPPQCTYKGYIDEAFATCYLRYFSFSGLDAFGTVKMSPKYNQNDSAVCDPALTPHGAQALRVVDSSAIPSPPGAPVYATVIMMAEKISDIVIAIYQEVI